MVIAIAAGIVLAAILFMKEIADMTRISDISGNKRLLGEGTTLPADWHAYRISGPLFFAAADRVFAELSLLAADHRGIILDLDGVPILDAGGLAALEKLVSRCRQQQTQLVLAGLQFQPLKTLARAGVKPVDGLLGFYPTLHDALDNLPRE